MSTITRWRSAFATMGFDPDQSNELCLLRLWVERGLIGGPTDGQESALRSASGGRIWTVGPDGFGGFHVLCDGQPVNWFPGYSRALNEARSRNHAETLRAEQRLRDNGMVE